MLEWWMIKMEWGIEPATQRLQDNSANHCSTAACTYKCWTKSQLDPTGFLHLLWRRLPSCCFHSFLLNEGWKSRDTEEPKSEKKAQRQKRGAMASYQQLLLEFLSTNHTAMWKIWKSRQNKQDRVAIKVLRVRHKNNLWVTACIWQTDRWREFPAWHVGQSLGAQAKFRINLR